MSGFGFGVVAGDDGSFGDQEVLRAEVARRSDHHLCRLGFRDGPGLGLLPSVFT